MGSKNLIKSMRCTMKHNISYNILHYNMETFNNNDKMKRKNGISIAQTPKKLKLIRRMPVKLEI